jgi:hypothetical protein
MESGGSFPERTWDFSLFACTGGSLGRGDPALPLAKRTGARVACPQSSVLPVQPASSVCKKLINTRCGSRTVAGPGASVLRSGQAMPHFVILRQLHNRVILARLDSFGRTDLHFFLGTTQQFHFLAPNPWVIIGVFPIPYEKQMDLL